MLYLEIVKNLEISKFTLINNKPLLNIIDDLTYEVNKLNPIVAFFYFQYWADSNLFLHYSSTDNKMRWIKVT